MKNKSLFLTLLMCASVGSNSFALKEKQRKVLNFAKGTALGAVAAANVYHSIFGIGGEINKDSTSKLWNDGDLSALIFLPTIFSLAYSTYDLGIQSKNSFDALSEKSAQQAQKIEQSNDQKKLIAKSIGYTLACLGCAYSTLIYTVIHLAEYDKSSKENLEKFLHLDNMALSVSGGSLAYSTMKFGYEAYLNVRAAIKNNNK